MGRAVSLLVSGAILAVLAAPALAAPEVDFVSFDDAVLDVGENVTATAQVTNHRDRRVRGSFFVRVRGNRLADKPTRRLRSRRHRIRYKLDPGETRQIPIEARVPGRGNRRAEGAMQLIVRERRRSRDPWVFDFYVLPDAPPAPVAGDVPFEPVVSVGAVRANSLEAHPEGTQVVRSEADWSRLLEDVDLQPPAAWGRSETGVDRPAYARPFDVDFETETVLAMFAGHKVHEDRVVVRSVRAAGDGTIVCRYEVQKHRPEGVFYTADHIWAPYLFVAVPRLDAEVRFERIR